jgi:hypothetical protein
MTGNHGYLSKVGIYEGEKQIADFNNLRLQGEIQNASWIIQDSPEIWWGILILIEVGLDYPGDWIQLVGATIEFS